MKILYLAIVGAADPTRASLPLHIAANGSVDQGQECAVALVGDGTELVSREKTERLEGVGIPRRESSFKNSLTTRSPSSSERAVPSPVGRPTLNWSG